MADERRLQADEQAPDHPSGMPAALAFVVFILGAAAGICYAMWLSAHQCIRVGGCG